MELSIDLHRLVELLVPGINGPTLLPAHPA